MPVGATIDRPPRRSSRQSMKKHLISRLHRHLPLKGKAIWRGGNREETGGQCPPLRMGLSTDYARRGDHWSPVFLWFPQHSPVGLTQKICWYDVKAPLKIRPLSQLTLTAPLAQGRFFRCALRIFKYANYRCPVRNKGINHSISHPLIQRKICIVLAGSGSFPVLPALSIPG